ncbi:hypothetical protein BV25DRAFT_1253724 [Artomyces pyxidatus]|uniref:Uncharacterized protein n=1 Tax=Artomyces pyxidatus TaxID=48021 RepID=A0ACB8TEJ4_9AGAM|nr:hypothetical protein BV25DRAFT_1253724 [Artomyces pyxidatus]
MCRRALNAIFPDSLLRLKRLRSIGACNNPFFRDPAYNDQPLVPAQYLKGPGKRRSAFGCHYFIATHIPPHAYPVVLDATCGPHGGHTTPPKKLAEYLSTVLETEADTTYYKAFDELPGRAQDVVDTWPGVSVTSEIEFNNRANVALGKIHALGPTSKAALLRDDTMVEDFLDSAQVHNCDPLSGSNSTQKTSPKPLSTPPNLSLMATYPSFPVQQPPAYTFVSLVVMSTTLFRL